VPAVDCVDDLGELTEIACGSSEIYIRYSTGPDYDEPGRSRDYEADVALPGLPVTTLRPEPWWPRPPADWVARRVCKYLELADKADDRRPWILTGRIAGYGPDHEPLVVDVEPIAWIGERVVTQARRCYYERFEVGRDSP
jgi:hypothetical protein